jgi:hypothetical protein
MNTQHEQLTRGCLWEYQTAIKETKWPSQRKYTTGNKENKEKHGHSYRSAYRRLGNKRKAWSENGPGCQKSHCMKTINQVFRTWQEKWSHSPFAILNSSYSSLSCSSSSSAHTFGGRTFPDLWLLWNALKTVQKTSNRPPRSPTHIRDDNIQMDVGDIWFHDVNLIQMAHMRVYWWLYSTFTLPG